MKRYTMKYLFTLIIALALFSCDKGNSACVYFPCDSLEKNCLTSQEVIAWKYDCEKGLAAECLCDQL